MWGCWRKESLRLELAWAGAVGWLDGCGSNDRVCRVTVRAEVESGCVATSRLVSNVLHTQTQPNHTRQVSTRRGEREGALIVALGVCATHCAQKCRRIC